MYNSGMRIEVWAEREDKQNLWWHVSLCDTNGNEIENLSVHNYKIDAIEAGRKAARKNGFQFCGKDKYGDIVEFASEEMMQMQSALLRYNIFSGSYDIVEHSAKDWVDCNFNADSADEWLSIDVWDAMTATQFRNAGLSPKQVEDAAGRLQSYKTLGYINNANSDGDPIYAACNGDIDAKVIIQEAKFCCTRKS